MPLVSLARGTGARRARTALALLAVALAPAAARAQGSVGTQGFGYPPGQVSTRARGSAGAVSEFDAQSPLNPAALAAAPGAELHVQYEPEFRTVEAGGARARSTLSRFPLVLAVLPVGQRLVLGISASTYLDRTFGTRFSDTVRVIDTLVNVQQTRRATGGITDVRVAAGRAIGRRLSVGVGVHGYTGENRVNVRFADDSGSVIAFTDSVRLNFSGLAASAGVSVRVADHVSAAASYKRGGTLTIRDDNTSERLAEARVPDRLGAGVLYDGVRGATFAATAALHRWSSLREATSDRVTTNDAYEFSLGADAAGPRFGSGVVALRAGAALRELPFALGEQAREVAFSLGAGLPLAANRATLDLTGQRARRTAGDARESAWLFSVGLTVRP